MFVKYPNKLIADNGYTAAQLVAKLISDPSAIAIVQHLVGDLPKQELKQLLLKELPEQASETLEFEAWGNDNIALSIEHLETLFALAYSLADQETKKAVAKRFVEVLKHEPAIQVRIFETHFFIVDYMTWLDPSDIRLVIEHLTASLETRIDLHQLSKLSGISQFLTNSDDLELFEPLFKSVGYDAAASPTVVDWITDESRNHAAPELTERLVARCGDWIANAQKYNHQKPHERFMVLNTELEPF